MEWGLTEPYLEDPNHLSKFVDFCIEIGLFTKEGEYIYSESLNRRMLKLKEIREKLQEAGKKGAEIRWGSHSTPYSNPIALKESKEKKSKDIKEPKKKFLEFVYLTNEEETKLIAQFGVAGTNERIQALNDYLGSKGDKYKSHYHTIKTWERKNKKEPPSIDNVRKL